MEAKIRGEVVIRALDEVRPNTWNPNVVPPHVFESLKHGLVEDGWIAAQALLVWGFDEQGQYQNIIIDGEHRWKAAREVGMGAGPMVFLNNISEREAKALTLKLDQKRGTWNLDKLEPLLRELVEGLLPEEAALDLGFSEAEIERALAPAPEQKDPSEGKQSINDLEKEFGSETDEKLFWPEIRIKVPKPVLAAWEAHLAEESREPHEVLAALIDAE